MERNHAPALRRGVTLTLALFVESVFNYRVFDVVFIQSIGVSRREGTSFRPLFSVVLLLVPDHCPTQRQFLRQYLPQRNSFIHRHSLRTGSNTFNTARSASWPEIATFPDKPCALMPELPHLRWHRLRQLQHQFCIIGG